ncbi:peptidoglycan biosynthesis/recognition protein [Winogradskyella pacifica]|uniref:Peptidoglycan biosynthesis/recognition protein n=1 Tax=Winogradskyella pacifica TaxID=664642 RepID=A0A3D9MDS7_9FLAO|nr:peptidogalycan biosysnthesis protein [Winogradskyella pacifica]REE17048.1 peptidoglycan biosynthesis/recognition protein [Winogradskyella pacifica]
MPLTSKVFKSIDTIPQPYWDSVNCCTNIYYSPEFLKAFELANTDIEFNYIFILKDQEAVAFANTQIVTIGVETITKNIKMSNKIRHWVNNMFCNNHICVLFCGNVFLSGEYGTFLKDGEDKVDTFKAIAEGVKQLSKSTKKLSAIFIKDFKNESLPITNHLESYDYAAMQVEPNMIITLKPEWHSFEDYTTALKSKYRVKANRADAKSVALNAKLFSEDDIEIHKDALQELYQNTIDNADFNAQILNLDTYIHLKRTFKDLFIVKGYFLEDKLVGFLSAMQNDTHLDAHFIGIDYSQNKEFGIYPRILNDYVRLGIETQSTQINLGRTASEIKSTLGAKPEALTCYCKHKRYLPNQVLKPFIKNVQIKSFKQHSVFK